MIRISPAVQLSLGLVFLTVSILIVAQTLGLAPGLDEQRMYTRQKLAENISLQTAMAVKRNDQFFLEGMFNQVVEQTPFILSIGLRKNNGSIIYQTASHNQDWGTTARNTSTPTHISVPIIIEGNRRGILEIAYLPPNKENDGTFGVPRFIWLILFVCCSGFIAFWFYIKRMLKQFDPSSVVPARVRNALNIMAEGVMILDKRNQIVLANDALVRKLETHEEKIIGRKASLLGWNDKTPSSDNTLSKHEQPPPIKLPWNTAQTTELKQVNVRLSRKDKNGKTQIFSVNSVPIFDEKGKSQGTISSFDDITDIESKNKMLREMLRNLVKNQKAIEEKNRELDFLASRDPLTNCFNRRTLYAKMEAIFNDKQNVSVVMLDIDHFKKINDQHGHGVGDEVIKGVADRVRAVIRKTDYIARIGGEEFCIVLESASAEKAQNIAEQCRINIAATTFNNIKVTASLGVSSIKFGAKSPEEIIQQADKALYESKNNGRNKTTLWQPETQTTHNVVKLPSNKS